MAPGAPAGRLARPIVSQRRYDEIDPDDNLRGAPELVIEVKSPSNIERKLRELASLVLAHGGSEFWIVDSERATVTVIHRDGSSAAFKNSQPIPLTASGCDDALPVDEPNSVRTVLIS